MICEAADYDVGFGGAEFHRRMIGLGWEYEANALCTRGLWHGPSRLRAGQKPLLGNIADLAAATLRDIFGASNPTQLAAHAFGNLRGIGELPYVAYQLGIRAQNL
ncbi:hypothetical protein [Nocardia sp. NPDC050793]|uniref:hypothetical protein n=1 Tax=Nocardia sp. NPDC050793 TaxID=3155159 RepID=UPI0033F2CB2D